MIDTPGYQCFLKGYCIYSWLVKEVDGVEVGGDLEEVRSSADQKGKARPLCGHQLCRWHPRPLENSQHLEPFETETRHVSYIQRTEKPRYRQGTSCSYAAVFEWQC